MGTFFKKIKEMSFKDKEILRIALAQRNFEILGILFQNTSSYIEKKYAEISDDFSEYGKIIHVNHEDLRELVNDGYSKKEIEALDDSLCKRKVISPTSLARKIGEDNIEKVFKLLLDASRFNIYTVQQKIACDECNEIFRDMPESKDELISQKCSCGEYLLNSHFLFARM